MQRIGFERGFQPPLVSLIRIAPSAQLRRRPRIALGGAFRNPCAQVLRKLCLARLLRGHFERSQFDDGRGYSLRQQDLLGGPRLRQCADFLFALLQPGEGLLPVLSALCSNALADCPLLISVLIVFRHEGFSVRSRCSFRSSRSADYEREYVRYVLGEAEAMSRVLPGPEKLFGRLTILFTCEVMTEYIGCFHADVVVDCEDCVPACFPFFKAEMRFRKKSMEGVPRGILTRYQRLYTLGATSRRT